jgi:hypothetical protein
MVIHHFSGMRIFFVILSEAKNLKLLIINALDSSLRSESLKSESFSEFNGIAEGNS